MTETQVDAIAPAGAAFSAPLGRVLFGIALMACGAQYVLHALTTVVPALGPPFAPMSPYLLYATGNVCLLAGACIVANFQTRRAALCVAIVLTVRIVVGYGPQFVTNVRAPGPWSSAFELLAFVGATLVLASYARVGQRVFAVSLIVFGVQHLLYPTFIAQLVTGWIPWKLLWAYVVGVGFLSSAVAIAFTRLRPIAATALALMFALFVVVLHIPRALAASSSGNEWTSAFVALGMCGASLLMIQSNVQRERAAD